MSDEGQEMVKVPKEEWKAVQDRLQTLEDLVEVRGDPTKPTNIWIAGHPVGKTLQDTKVRTFKNKKNIQKLQLGEVEAEDVVMADPEAYLPIQQNWNAVKAGVDHGLSRNQELAARIWPHFRAYCDPSGGKLSLTSPMVNDIIERELEMGDINPNTRKRAMRFIARFSDGLVEFDDSSHTNKLVADREEWMERMEEMAEAHQEVQEEADRTEEVQQAVDAEVDRLAQATTVEKDYGVVRPDGGEGVN